MAQYHKLVNTFIFSSCCTVSPHINHFHIFFLQNFFVLQEDLGLRLHLAFLPFIQNMRTTLLWLAFRISNPLCSPFPIVIPQQYRAAMFSLCRSELPWQRAEKAWRSLKASSVRRALLASADDYTVSFIFMKENKRQDWRGDNAAQLNTPERLTPHSAVVSSQIATGIVIICRGQTSLNILVWVNPGICCGLLKLCLSRVLSVDETIKKWTYSVCILMDFVIFHSLYLQNIV